MKPPGQCRSLEEVRSAIDGLDEQIVGLLGRRARYVRAAAAFKASPSEVSAPGRLAAMLEVRRHWAAREGLDPDFVEKLYREMVAHFISCEMADWKRARNPGIEHPPDP
jgi:isochorismate pyruvate lyase